MVVRPSRWLNAGSTSFAAILDGRARSGAPGKDRDRDRLLGGGREQIKRDCPSITGERQPSIMRGRAIFDGARPAGRPCDPDSKQQASGWLP